MLPGWIDALDQAVARPSGLKLPDVLGLWDDLPPATAVDAQGASDGAEELALDIEVDPRSRAAE